LQEKIRELRAMQYPDEAAAHKPPPEFYFHRGNALFRLGRAEEALASWERCVAEKPQFPLVYNNLAIIFMQQGRIDEALRSLSKAEELGVTVNPKLKADLLARAAAGAGADQRP
jgi:tetratricopeptide (TPR) repeat protein